MKNFKIENNKIVIDMSAIKSKKHLYNFNMMVGKNKLNDALSYLDSFNGVRARNLSFNSNKNSLCRDVLNVNKDKYFKIYNSMLDANKQHNPISFDTQYFGVEIECFIPYIATCTNGDIDDSTHSNQRELKKLFSQNKIKFATVKSDGSIRETEGHFPVEITILTKFNDTSNLQKACELLNNLGAKVNKSCGLHVHLDSRNLSESQVLEIGKNFKKALPVLLKMVPKSRRDNSYCRASVSKMSGQRYHAVNLTAFSKYKTIEIRLHSSTTDFNKIMNWANLLNAIKKSTIKKTCQNINDLTDYIKIDENLLEYVAQRTALFNGESDISISAKDLDNTDSNAA